jgi:hypothetical protein
MIYLIRHGERTDDPSSLYDKKLIKLTFDPALT